MANTLLAQTVRLDAVHQEDFDTVFIPAAIPPLWDIAEDRTHADFDHVMAAIRDGAIPVSKLITHHTTLQDSPHDISRWAHQKSGLIKAGIAC